jgi:MoaA/NifB/PqqE/SkfB family radical SAM enzyme
VYAVDQLVSDPAALAGVSEAIRGGAPAVRDAKLKVTSRCNLACQMCDYWRTTREETLSLEEWPGVIDQLADLGCRKLHVSGGEPFLRPDLLEILEHGVARKLKVNLTTNGTLLTEDRIRRLARSGVNAVSVSLDGPTAKLHDRIRGRPGSFKRSVKAIRRLVRAVERRQARLKVRINVVLMRENYRRLPDMVRLAADLGAVDLVPMPVDAGDEGPERMRLTLRELRRFNAEVAPAAHAAREEAGFSCPPERVHPFGASERDLAYAERGRYARGYHERRPCYAPWLHTFVAGNGDVFLCCMTASAITPLGNLRQSSLREVLEGERYREVRADFLRGRNLDHCHRCDLFSAENRALAQALRDSPGADPLPRRRLVVVEPPTP